MTNKAEPIKPNLAKIEEDKKLEELDSATKARLQAAEKAKVRTQTGSLVTQPAKS